jgi:hypothetical protein
MSVASSLVSGIFALIGIYRLRGRHRMAAYRWFDRSVLVSIFVTQVFAFAKSEFSATFALGLYVLIWAMLRYMIGLERKIGAREKPAPAPARTPRPALAR